MNRRQVLGAAIGAAAAVVVARFAFLDASAAPLDEHARHEREMISHGVYGWESHLLPFAAPLPTAAGVRAELARGRALGLFR